MVSKDKENALNQTELVDNHKGPLKKKMSVKSIDSFLATRRQEEASSIARDKDKPKVSYVKNKDGEINRPNQW